MKLSLEDLKSLLNRPELDRKKENLIADCPVCNEHEFGIAIDKNNHPWQCYRKKNCGASGTIFTLLKLLNRFDLVNTIRVPENRELLVKKIKGNVRKKVQLEFPDLIIPTIKPPVSFTRIYKDDYLTSRGFTEYEKYPVGTTDVDIRLKHDFIIFMVYQYGELKGFVARNRKSKVEIDSINKLRKEKGLVPILRYSNSVETDFATLLFGYDDITESTKIVILVEGIFDKLKIDRLLNLNSQEEVKCVCTFGSSISEEQKYLLFVKKISILILIYDGDVIGKIKKTSLELKSDFEKVLVGFHPTKDPDQMNSEDLDYVMDNLEDPSEFNLNKVSKKVLKI